MQAPVEVARSPSAQATAALIGLTWLTTTTSPSAPGAGAARGEQLLAGVGDAPVHLGQGLAALGPEVTVAPPAPPHLGGMPPSGWPSNSP